MVKKKTILVSPLNWGLGHATRCIPLIRALLENNYNVLLASDGAALLLLEKEFPQLSTVKLPSYSITYPKKRIWFKWKILLKLPAIQQTMLAEKDIVQKLVDEGTIDGIISDNRFGVRNKDVPSVFITHQINVLTGSTSYISTKIHQNIIKKFDACWVPDVDDLLLNLSGKLGHSNFSNFPITYIGSLSRMHKMQLEKKYDILALLSGPEPQRSLLENTLKKSFKNTSKTILLVQGIVEKEQKWKKHENINVVNFMESEELEAIINASEVVICRSGYTSIMDLTALEKNAFFIPTPGQYEQEYLAKRLEELGIVPSCKQNKFKLEELNKIVAYKGLKSLAHPQRDFRQLFCLFEGE